MSELRNRMIRDMTVRGFSPRTHEAYIRAVVGLAKHYRRSPDQLAHDEVQAYLAHLHQHRKLAWSSCSQAAHAFRFLYHTPSATSARSSRSRPHGSPRHSPRFSAARRYGACSTPARASVIGSCWPRPTPRVCA
jgi:hypothetical protein